MAESRAAIIHTIVRTRLTGMPSRAARSVFSADALIDLPKFENLKNAPNPTVTATTRMIVSKCSPLKSTPPMLWR